MSYETYENATELHIVGVCFIDELATPKSVIVDGDLIATRLHARSITVTHGSLLCPTIEADEVNAEILGIPLGGGGRGGEPSPARGGEFPLASARHVWLRPFKQLPDPHAWHSAESIHNVVDLLTWPEITTNPAPAARLLARVTARPTCGRARVLLHAALEELQLANALTPLGARVVASFLVHADLPAHWRW